MDRRFPTIALAALVLSMVALAVPADSIKLDSGKVVEGAIVTETSGVVQVAIGGAVLTIPRNKIVAISKGGADATSGTATLEQLQTLELKGQWADLYEAATRVLSRETSNPVAVEKQKLAADKIREDLGWKKIAELVRDRKFDEALTTFSEQFRRSGLSSRGAGAVGRRALAELYLGSAQLHMRASLDGHVPLNEARKARELDPSTPGLDYVEGLAQVSLHNFDQAIVLLERALRADPRNFGIWFQIMTCHHEKGDFERVVRMCEAASAETSASAKTWPEVRAMIAEAHGLMAGQLADQGKKAQAAAVYEKRLAFSERTAEDLRDAAAFFERIGEPERAKALRSERPQPRRADTRTTSGTLIGPGLRR